MDGMDMEMGEPAAAESSYARTAKEMGEPAAAESSYARTAKRSRLSEGLQGLECVDGLEGVASVSHAAKRPRLSTPPPVAAPPTIRDVAFTSLRGRRSKLTYHMRVDGTNFTRSTCFFLQNKFGALLLLRTQVYTLQCAVVAIPARSSDQGEDYLFFAVDAMAGRSAAVTLKFV